MVVSPSSILTQTFIASIFTYKIKPHTVYNTIDIPDAIAT